MREASIVMAERMKRLPRRHRIAHLRALIKRESGSPVRRFDLVALLGHEAAAQPGGSRAR
jgi:hypothetical protein